MRIIIMNDSKMELRARLFAGALFITVGLWIYVCWGSLEVKFFLLMLGVCAAVLYGVIFCAIFQIMCDDREKRKAF